MQTDLHALDCLSARCLRQWLPGIVFSWLWERYQRCLITTDPAEFALIIGQFERVMPIRVEPPAWMKAWGEGVTSQPLRTAVDPQALAAACTLHAADVLAKDGGVPIMAAGKVIGAIGVSGETPSQDEDIAVAGAAAAASFVKR